LLAKKFEVTISIAGTRQDRITKNRNRPRRHRWETGLAVIDRLLKLMGRAAKGSSQPAARDGQTWKELQLPNRMLIFDWRSGLTFRRLAGGFPPSGEVRPRERCG
jgi:hypothetical protein